MVIDPGTQFAHLTVIQEIDPVGPNRRFLCRCSCGNEKIAYLNNLRAGRATSCGCTYPKWGVAGRASALKARRLRSQESDEGRICLTCNEWKPWSCFSTDKKKINGRSSNCLECGRWRTLAKQYGLSRAQWDQLLESQNGVCALCDGPNIDSRSFNVDHDHSCCGPDKAACANCIRGLLCDTCNRLIGLAEQKPRLRELFGFYLDRRPLKGRN